MKKKLIWIPVCLLLLLGAAAALIFLKILPDRHYAQAAALAKAGDYPSAIAAFETLNGYRDADEQIALCRTAISQQAYDAALSLAQPGSWEQAAEAFSALGDFSDAAARAEYCRNARQEELLQADYASAEALLTQKDFSAAIAAFEALGDYSDAAARAAAIPESGAYLAAQLAQLEVGDFCSYGVYEQDNDLSNGPEPLEWKILAKEEGRMLLITRSCIDCRAWNDSWIPSTWETCEMRAWLNSGFTDTAFTASQQEVILLTDLLNETNPFHNVSSGNDTQDRVFLLSYNEAASLFPNNWDRRAVSTAYAKSKSAFTGNTGGSRWWLRTSGWDNYYAVYVHSDGHVVNYDSCQTYADYWTVRPALWLDIS